MNPSSNPKIHPEHPAPTGAPNASKNVSSQNPAPGFAIQNPTNPFEASPPLQIPISNDNPDVQTPATKVRIPCPEAPAKCRRSQSKTKKLYPKNFACVFPQIEEYEVLSQYLIEENMGTVSALFAQGNGEFHCVLKPNRRRHKVTIETEAWGAPIGFLEDLEKKHATTIEKQMSAAKPRRRKGRPKKSPNQQDKRAESAAKSKRGKGRPKKSPNQQDKHVNKVRGRPKKNPAPAAEIKTKDPEEKTEPEDPEEKNFEKEPKPATATESETKDPEEKTEPKDPEEKNFEKEPKPATATESETKDPEEEEPEKKKACKREKKGYARRATDPIEIILKKPRTTKNTEEDVSKSIKQSASEDK